MESLLYFVVELISEIHSYIMSWNDGIQNSFTDKELHFLVIGVLGIVMIFVVHAVFLWLANRGHLMTISFIYVLTLIVVITFAIEIGQKLSGTGHMEFADIAAGLIGFVLMYAVFAIIRGICHWIMERKS